MGNGEEEEEEEVRTILTHTPHKEIDDRGKNPKNFHYFLTFVYGRYATYYRARYTYDARKHSPCNLQA